MSFVVFTDIQHSMQYQWAQWLPVTGQLWPLLEEAPFSICRTWLCPSDFLKWMQWSATVKINYKFLLHICRHYISTTCIAFEITQKTKLWWGYHTATRNRRWNGL